ncbi:MAG: histidine decarboxylase [Chloroflexota bacterium]|nr:histidine decarboxylase [Chloroflexota bacterium]MDE2929382.1 histidine decarboxylase [Chloroflexota bacterium]
MSQAEIEQRIHRVLSEFEAHSPFFAGYPVNQDFDYTKLYPLLSYPANNVGDPFGFSRYLTNTHETEREVVHEVAELMRLPADEAWGYVTTGGTEGNMYGIYVGRELLRNPVAYFSQDTHYSVLKILHVLNVRNIMIRSQENGEIDYDDLRESIRINRDVPALIVANIGTTMKGAIDDLERIHGIAEELSLPRYYIHADAALSGMILPFVDDPQPFGFDSGIDSIAISGHKLIGSPVPCGVVVTKREYTAQIGRAIEYVGVLDTTLLGSRSALSPMIIWYAFAKHGREGYRQIVAQMLDTAEYAVQQFNAHGIPAWRAKNSVTVVFPRPSPYVVFEWQLAPLQDIAHLITMPHVTREMVDKVIADCLEWPAET